MVCMNVFGPCISGPNLMLTMRTSQHNMQIFLADMSADSSPTLGLITTLETIKIYSFVIGVVFHIQVDIQV